jgi:peptidoglycan/xylan/chitin deacetylase (PgdA/CDA1 family)
VLWPDLVRYAVRATTESRLDLTTLANGAGPWTVDLITKTDRLRAVWQLESALKRVPNARKEGALDELSEKLLGVDRGSAIPPRLMMSWEELSTIAREGMAVGAHTVTHPILTRVAASDAEEEIGNSKSILEGRLGRPVTHFAYPNGQRADVSPGVRAIVEGAGFASASTTLGGVNRPGSDRFSLKRVDSGQPPWRGLCRSWA